MNETHKKLFKSALKNQEFMIDLGEVEETDIPGHKAPDKAKIIFCMVYFGWMIAKHGTDWENEL